MLEIKGRTFEGELADTIRNTPGMIEMLEEIYSYEVEEDSTSWS